MNQLALLPLPENFTKNANALLTKREAEVITLLADGHTWKSAADRLGISHHTIRVYVQHIHLKLKVPNTPAAILLLCR